VLSFHAGPEQGVPNSKKIKKNMRPSGGIILGHLDMRKKFKPTEK
jgi:hypothetical protein